MSNLRKTIALFIVLAFAASAVMPLAMYSYDPVSIPESRNSAVPAATVLVVEYEELNHLDSYNDDDFKFTVYNGSAAPGNIIGLANVTLYNSTGSFYESHDTAPGDGTATFFNVPQGTYTFNVTLEHATGGYDPDEYFTGVINSDGPEATVEFQFGNIDWDNDDDDLTATIFDVEGEPAEELNFTIVFQENSSVFYEVKLNGTHFELWDIPAGNYTWKVIVPAGTYLGLVLDQSDFIADGTAKFANRRLGPITGRAEYYDLEVITYYETSRAPIPGVLVNVTYYNGTVIDAKATPSNGSVIFIDLPIAFINVTITYEGVPIGADQYTYNLTEADRDLRAPIISQQSDVEYLITDTNITLTWHVEDDYPWEIQVLIGGELNQSQIWNETSYDFVFNVTAALPTFTIGYYEVVVIALDVNGNDANDTFQLRIYENATPIISGPEDVAFYYGETGHSLLWNVTDDYMNQYVVERSGNEVASGLLDEEAPFVSVSLDGLSVGVYTYELRVNDTSGNEATDEVLVTVNRDDIDPVITYTPPAIFYAQGSGAIVRNWTAIDDHKATYSISVDGVVVESGDWITENIGFDFSGLNSGDHVVVLTVYDLGGNYASASVEVHVSIPVALAYILVAAISAGVLVAVGIIVWFVRYR
ncbi:MAG: hypothetical protein ACFFAY_13510 [Promethearchaeota archaeon]